VEAAEIAAFEVDDPDVPPNSPDYIVMFSPGNRFLEPSSIQRMLSGLVTVENRPLSSSRDDVVIYFAHSSVQDYLRGSSVTPAAFRLDFKQSRFFILKTYMAYVKHYDEADASGQKQPPYPLLGYACQRGWADLKILDILLGDGWLSRKQLPVFTLDAKGKGKAATLSLRFAAELWGGATVGDAPFQPSSFSFDEFQTALNVAAAAGEPALTKIVLDSSATFSTGVDGLACGDVSRR